MAPTEDERRGLANPSGQLADASLAAPEDDIVDTPLTVDWDLLPPPRPRPVQAAGYRRPKAYSPDRVRVRLISGFWLPLALVFTFFFALGCLVPTLNGTARSLLPLLLVFSPLLLMAAFAWFKVSSAPSLEVDSEGFTLTRYGISRSSVDVLWSDIASLRLHARGLPRGSYELHLFITPRAEDPLASAPRKVQDISLGMTGIGKVNRSLRAHRPPNYSVTWSEKRFPW